MTVLPKVLSYKQIFKFWLPLEATWLMMAAEGSFLSAVIARLPEPKYNLAAFGLAFVITLFIESPVLNLISASNSLVRDWASYLKMRRFAGALILAVSLIMGIVLLPPVFNLITETLIGLPSRISRLTFQASALLLPVPWAIGYRRFYHGILIQNGRTRSVALGTMCRLLAMSLSGAGLFLFSSLPGAVVGAGCLMAGVIFEALVSRLMAAPILKDLQKRVESATSANDQLTYRDITSFYLPLALTSLIALGINPVISYFLAKGRMSIESLAVWPVIQALLMMFLSFGLSFHETAIALLGPRNENFKKLRNFALVLGLVTVSLFGLFGFSPLADLWFEKVSALSPDLADFIRTPVQLLIFMPLLWMMLTFQRSVLVNTRRTSAITWATALDFSLIVAVMGIGIHVFEAIGVFAAVTALLIGRLGAVSCLLFPFFKALKRPRSNNHPHAGKKDLNCISGG
ncbi:MAG: hypothetical protein HY892_21270 [Deltaproteobacteria bacterium]|nr:hypothetical protein [Deltaproteobacteria bacterium]